MACSLWVILSFSANGSTAEQTLVNAIHSKNRSYHEAQPLRSIEELREKRLAIQTSVLEEFYKNPEAFIKQIPKKERHYLFDAVVDPQVMIRVGRPGDGGKWVCNLQLLGEHPIVYSFGVGDDISFDTDMAGLFGAQVYMFDPNPIVVKVLPPLQEGYPCGAGRLFYYPIGLGPVSAEKDHEWDLVIKGKKCQAKSLLDIARSFHHSRVDILKIDIEGGEFAALHEILSSGALAALDVKMLLVEFHLWNQDLFRDFVDLIGSLTKENYLIYRKEFNATNIKCAEYALVKLSFLNSGQTEEPGGPKANQ
jgi:hypothetical protein